MTRTDLPEVLLEAVDAAVAGPLSGYRPLRVFLFGSRARGSADVRSDYDIGVDAGRPLDARDMADLRDLLDAAPILARVDVVDFRQVDAQFREIALRNVVPLHDRAA